ncbi:MAG: signal recognition particle-docking protein FtsY [Melioribacteraceae bacterium]|nr:signal recognition particle-docking protein FtsY [Melioribacteraceae bacterium]
MGFLNNINFKRLKEGLTKTRKKIFDNISEAVSGKAVLDETVLDEIEEILISGDIGLETSTKIIETTRNQLKNINDRTYENIISNLKLVMKNILLSSSNPDISNISKDKIAKYAPYVILVVGVNGAGKTTTIGKLANKFKLDGYSVLIGSADTFRAAANEQLDIWAKRANVQVIKRNPGADPSSVAYETLSYAKTNKIDIVIIDTAGRLHTKQNLMQELEKIKKVIKKVVIHAPNETLLVVDGNTGQNAIIQAREFTKFIEITGLVVTKLDGSAKGGVIFQICSELNIPVNFICVGETMEDLQSFIPELYVNALFN